MDSLRYHGVLYLQYLKVSAKVLAEYRADLWIGFASAVIYQGMTVLFITLVFTKLRVIEGWGFYEVLLIYGLVTSSRQGSGLLLHMPWMLHFYITRGHLDSILVRPANTLVQMIGGARVDFQSTGSMAMGIAAIVIALVGLNVEFQLWWGIYIPIVVVSGIVLSFAIKLIVASIGFWVIGARSLMHPVTWVSDFAQFPVVIYPIPILIVLSWVLPYAMMGFYPAAFMLRGDEYSAMGLAAPLMGWLFLGASLIVWNAGMRRYESTG